MKKTLSCIFLLCGLAMVLTACRDEVPATPAQYNQNVDGTAVSSLPAPDPDKGRSTMTGSSTEPEAGFTAPTAPQPTPTTTPPPRVDPNLR